MCNSKWNPSYKLEGLKLFLIKELDDEGEKSSIDIENLIDLGKSSIKREETTTSL